MDKCTDKFCSNCGHHLYFSRDAQSHDLEKIYFCTVCNLTFPESEIATEFEVWALRAEFEN